jgi:hypothetical protein
VYVFSDGPLGITVSQRIGATKSTRWNRTVTGRVNAADFKLVGIDQFLSRLPIAPASIDNPGVAFIVERDGSLIGTSQGSASYSSPLCKGKARAVQINCMATDVPVPGDVARACKQLQVRAGGFVTDYFAGTVGHGANGRIILRAAQITDPSVANLDWLCVISLNFDAFIHVSGLLSFMVVFCILHTMRSAPTMVVLVI